MSHFYVYHYDKLPPEFFTKSCVDVLSLIKSYDTVLLDPYASKEWDEYRYQYEVMFGMHPFVKYDQEKKICYAVEDAGTWTNVGMVYGYLLHSERKEIVPKPTTESTSWWFEKYPKLLSVSTIEPNDIVLVFKAFVRPPPLTQTESIPVGIELLKRAFTRFMYLPRDMSNLTLKEMIVSNVKKWDDQMYCHADKHPSELPVDSISVIRDPVYIHGIIVSVFIDMFLYKSSPRYILPTLVVPVRGNFSRV